MPTAKTTRLATSLDAAATHLRGTAGHHEVHIPAADAPAIGATADLLAQYAAHLGADAVVIDGPMGPASLTVSGPGHRVACVLSAAVLAINHRGPLSTDKVGVDPSTGHSRLRPMSPLWPDRPGRWSHGLDRRAEEGIWR